MFFSLFLFLIQSVCMPAHSRSVMHSLIVVVCVDFVFSFLFHSFYLHTLMDRKESVPHSDDLFTFVHFSVCKRFLLSLHQMRTRIFQLLIVFGEILYVYAAVISFCFILQNQV